MADDSQLRLKALWDQAFREYYNTQQQIDLQIEEKKRKGLFRHRDKDHDNDKIVVSKPPPPRGMSVDEFKAGISRSQSEFSAMRSKNHKIFDILSDMAGPIQVIGGQASAIGGMFSPAAPMVFSAVMYLFSVGKKVEADLDAMAQLFYRCNEHMVQISLLVKARQLAVELQDIIIGSLIAILDVCRISTYYVQRGRLQAFMLTLAGAGGGEAGAALARLKDLAQGRDSTTIGATYVAVDELQDKSDKLLVGVSGISDQVLETQNMIMKKLSLMAKEKGDDKQAKDPRDSKATLQQIKVDSRDALRGFLKPDFSITDRFKELHKSTTLGTCEWIFEEEIEGQKLETWVEKSKDPILWIYGQSGSGKSHLAAKIAENFGPSHLLGDSDASKVAVAAYFFDYSGVAELDDQTTSGSNGTNNEDEKSEIKEDEAEVKAKDKADSKPSSEANGTSSKDDATEAAKDESEDEGKDEPAASRDNQCINEMLRTVCWQLCQDDKRYQTYLADRLTKLKKDIPRDDSTPAPSVWNSLFNVPHFIDLKGRPVVLVIDGVDNLHLSDRSVFYDLLEEVVKVSTADNTPRIKFIVLSQANLVKDEIAEFKWSSSVPAIFITEEKNHGDIEIFISASVEKSRKLRRALADQSFREEAVKKLAETTHGVFEMATLLVKQLQQKDHVDLVDEVLEAPPENIQSILRQTIEHFGDTHTTQDIEDLNSLLAWVLYGYDQPLTLEQLNAAMGLESKHGEFLDIRDKISREFSAYFSIIGDHKGQSISMDQSGLVNTSDQPAIAEGTRRVKLAHASIATHFRSSEAAEGAKLNIPIGMSRPTAHLRIARTCLLALSSKDNPKKLRRPSNTETLLGYAASNFHKHLTIARPPASPAEKLEVVLLLLKVFRNEKYMEDLAREPSFWPTWFVADGAIDEVWAWISDKDIQENLPKEDAEWINKPNISIQEKLLKPVCDWFSKKLFQDLDYEINNSSMFYFMFLYGFKLLFEQPLAPLNAGTTHPYYKAQKLSPDEIREVAEWAGLEKTALWHTRLGYVLEDLAGGLRAGLADWETAIKIDPNFGQTYFVLAYYHADEKEYDTAIELMKESRRLKYNVEGGSSRRGAMFIAEWQQERAEAQDAGEMGIQNGVNEALKTLEDELQAFPNSFDLVAEYIRVSSKGRRHRTTMASLRNLGSKLPEFLKSEDASELHQEMRRAAQYTHSVGVLRRAYERAINSLPTEKNDPSQPDISDKMRLLNAVAKLYAENQEDDKALDIYDKIIEAFDDDDHWLPSNAKEAKAELCWMGAVNKSSSSEERNDDFEKLVELEKQEHLPDIDSSRYHAGLLLGLYHRVRGDDEAARPFFRDRIALGLSFLEDEDTDNDYEAYLILYQSLTKAGDLKNGVAARSLYLKEIRALLDSQRAERELTTKSENTEPESDAAQTSQESLEKDAENHDAKDSSIEKDVSKSDPGSKKTEPKTLDTETYPDTPWNWGTCDGVCNRNMSEYKESVHTCTCCLDIDFCNDCFPKHQDGSLPYKLCDPDHVFVICVGAPKDLPDDLVKVDGKVVDRKGWLDGIRREWGLVGKGEKEKVEKDSA